MNDDAAGRLLSGDAWAGCCRRLEALGRSLLGPGFPQGPRERTEGLRALTRQLAFALQWEVPAGDPRAPTFVRFQDPCVQWGGPNPDNVYLAALRGALPAAHPSVAPEERRARLARRSAAYWARYR
jgi:hypothetical protein